MILIVVLSLFARAEELILLRAWLYLFFKGGKTRGNCMYGSRSNLKVGELVGGSFLRVLKYRPFLCRLWFRQQCTVRLNSDLISVKSVVELSFCTTWPYCVSVCALNNMALLCQCLCSEQHGLTVSMSVLCYAGFCVNSVPL